MWSKNSARAPQKSSRTSETGFPQPKPTLLRGHFSQRGNRPAPRTDRHPAPSIKHGAHAITANKGPIVHAYRELRDLAAAHGKRFLFESTVMDGVPYSSFVHQMPAIHLQGFHGILNSTTNVILSEMENGLSFEESLKKAQVLGIAETDATHDIDGWDAAVKTAALITVLMDIPVRLEDIHREGIRELTTNAVRNGRRDGWPPLGYTIKYLIRPSKICQ